jgi:hypothetical protein
MLHAPHLSLVYATYPPDLILLDSITQIIFSEQSRSWNSSLCSVLHSCVTLFLLDPSTSLSTLFSNTLSLSSTPNVGDQALHPYKSTGKICWSYTVGYVNGGQKIILYTEC